MATCVCLGNLLSAAFASGVRENLQWTDEDCDENHHSPHQWFGLTKNLWCAVFWKVFCVCRRLGGMIVSGLVVPSFAERLASSLPGIPIWLGIQLIVKFLLLVLHVCLNVFVQCDVVPVWVVDVFNGTLAVCVDDDVCCWLGFGKIWPSSPRNSRWPPFYPQ